jgi:hypothetical protein
MADDGLTMDQVNAALLPVSREHGYCLCIHPFMQIVNFTGLSCQWCEQPCTDEAYTPEAKAIRTEAIKAAYPEKVKVPDADR